MKIINVKITPSIHQFTHPSTNPFTYLFVNLPACPSIHLLPLCLVYLPDAFPVCLPYLLGYCLAYLLWLPCLSCLVCLLSEGKIRQGEVTGKSTCGRSQAWWCKQATSHRARLVYIYIYIYIYRRLCTVMQISLCAVWQPAWFCGLGSDGRRSYWQD